MSRNGSFLLLCILFFSLNIFSQESKIKDEVKEKLKIAKEAFDKKEYDRAIKFLEEAYKIKPSPFYIFNIARCYEEKREIERAIEKFEEYIEIEKDEKEKEKARLKIEELKKKLPYGILKIINFKPDYELFIDSEKKEYKEGEFLKLLPNAYELKILSKERGEFFRIIEVTAGSTIKIEPEFIPFLKEGEVRVEGLLEGAKFFIDGKEIKEKKLKEGLKMPAGLHKLSIEKEGYIKFEKDFEIKEGEKEIIKALMIKKEEKVFPYNTIGYITAGGAVALLGAGVTFTMLANGDRDRVEGKEVTMKEAKELEKSANKKDKIAIIFYSSSGAFAITSGIMFYLNYKAKKSLGLNISILRNSIFFSMNF